MTIEANGLTKRYGDKLAVDSLSFEVKPGVVTGFLGPNGAGKSTTMRMLLGLDKPTSGTATIGGSPYASLDRPLTKVGALLEAKAFHPGRSPRNHLRYLAQTQGLPTQTVDKALALVGLEKVANKRAGKFSLGMGQRLGLAAALLGDPSVVVLDEPVNGLDPEGVRWIRNMMRDLAAQGRTVLISSHLMAEMTLTADHLIVIGKGRLLADCSTAEFIAHNSETTINVRSPELERLAAMLEQDGAHIQTVNGSLRVINTDAARVGDIAADAGIRLHELTTQTSSLEEAFLKMTRGSVEYTQGSAK